MRYVAETSTFMHPALSLGHFRLRADDGFGAGTLFNRVLGLVALLIDPRVVAYLFLFQSRGGTISSGSSVLASVGRLRLVVGAANFPTADCWDAPIGAASPCVYRNEHPLVWLGAVFVSSDARLAWMDDRCCRCGELTITRTCRGLFRSISSPLRQAARVVSTVFLFLLLLTAGRQGCVVAVVRAECVHSRRPSVFGGNRERRAWDAAEPLCVASHPPMRSSPRRHGAVYIPHAPHDAARC